MALSEEGDPPLNCSSSNQGNARRPCPTGHGRFLCAACAWIPRRGPPGSRWGPCGPTSRPGGSRSLRPNTLRGSFSPGGWERLVALKDRYDSNNTFRFGRDILASSAAVSSGTRRWSPAQVQCRRVLKDRPYRAMGPARKPPSQLRTQDVYGAPAGGEGAGG
jgi:hypothetical protein